MPVINIDELVGDLKDYLPSENLLNDNQLESIISNIIQNQVEENDEKHYSEVLCKSLRSAAILNNSKYSVDGAGLLREEVGDVAYWYSEKIKKNIWKDFISSLPSICPYLPKGGYNLPSTIGILVKKGEEVKVTSCDDSNNLIL